jgi:hypothetical protein
VTQQELDALEQQALAAPAVKPLTAAELDALEAAAPVVVPPMTKRGPGETFLREAADVLSLVGSANIAGAGGALYEFGQRLGARPVEITPGAPVQRPEVPYSQAFGEQRSETLRALTEAEAQNPEVALATAVGTTLATGFIPGAQGRGLATIGGKLAGRLGPTAARVGEVALPAAVRTAGMALGRVSGEDAGEDAMSVAKAAGAYGATAPLALAAQAVPGIPGRVLGAAIPAAAGAGLFAALEGRTSEQAGQEALNAAIMGTLIGVPAQYAAEKLTPTQQAVTEYLKRKSGEMALKAGGMIQKDIQKIPIEERIPTGRALLEENLLVAGEYPSGPQERITARREQVGQSQRAIEQAVDEAMATKAGLPAGDIGAVRQARAQIRRDEKDRIAAQMKLEQARVAREVAKEEERIAQELANRAQAREQMRSDTGNKLAKLEQDRDALAQMLAQNLTDAQGKVQAATAANAAGVSTTRQQLESDVLGALKVQELLRRKLTNTRDLITGTYKPVPAQRDPEGAALGAYTQEEMAVIPFQPLRVPELRDIAALPKNQQYDAIDALANKMLRERAPVLEAGLRGMGVQATSIDPEVARLAGMKPTDRAAALQELAAARTAQAPTAPGYLTPELERIAKLPEAKRPDELRKLATKMYTSGQAGPVDEELAAVLAIEDPAKRSAEVAKLADRRLVMPAEPQPKTIYPPMRPLPRPDEELVAGIGIDAAPIIRRIKAEVLPGLRSGAAAPTRAMVLREIDTLEREAERGMTVSELRRWKTQLNDALKRGGLEPTLKTKMSGAVASIYDDAVETAVGAQLGDETLQQYKATKELYGKLAKFKVPSAQAEAREVGNRQVSLTDYLVGMGAGGAAAGAAMVTGSSTLPALAAASLPTMAAMTVNQQLRLRGPSTIAVKADKLAKYIEAPRETRSPAANFVMDNYAPTIRTLAEQSPQAAAVYYYLASTRDRRFRQADEEAQKEAEQRAASISAP